MKRSSQKRFVFIAKSLAWSLLLYALFMLAFNWDDVSNKVRGVNPITIVNNIPSGSPASGSSTAPASISGSDSILNLIITVFNGIEKVFG